MAFEFISSVLNQRKQDKLWRSRHIIESAVDCMIQVDGRHYLNFSSNDYLGLRRSTVVAQAWVDGIAEYTGGSGASPLVTGYTQAHHELEVYLAKVLKRDKVLLFNSGFTANQAICQALFSAGSRQSTDLIVADKLMHASFVDGAQACDAVFKRFRHNDCQHLSSILRSQSAVATNTLIATEGVFSMDGDQAPILELLNITQQHDAWLMLDDAHGFGVLGETGLGVSELHQLSQQKLPVLMATFGKAIGTAGAFIAGSEQLIDYLVNFARHYIYSTAMPAAQAHATLESLKANVKPDRRHLLQTRIQQFKQLAKAVNIPLLPSDTAIQPILIGDTDLTLALSEKLKQLGIWASAIRYPTVPKGTDRLRLTLSAIHQERDIVALVDALSLAISSLKKSYI
ncbi:aminotransferase class I/II-fold pyridoxal phosphate-dependent enzyme [Paraglaciecola hydrolytica]|uniref:8-amino-7-oxononanoate synthase n=1 Tax=Paraglaciecola hydrolytica TaxID=1799789 RepID=A0A136A6A2_9ALTE|nr:8-amino-7-oxononanoate synthase [Paraglaciecola hydrolytica]KXI30759.1 8-amino-7-oxononanoate synthase [Paraglaciecola hydrolytica]